MNDRTVSWPEWDVVFGAWNELHVPDIEFREFEIGRSSVRQPWVERQTGECLRTYSNPQHATAYHLACILPKTSPELQAAYKLYAFCVEHRLGWFPLMVLAQVFQKFDYSLGWWEGNARYVLPPAHADTYFFVDANEAAQANAWRNIVQKAAEIWAEIAQNWSIVLLPELMDTKSLQYHRYVEYAESVALARERDEYERLKNKFEPSPG